MKEFKEYYSKDQIIKYLCKIRIKYANKRNKKYLLNKLTKSQNHLKELPNPYEEEIIRQLDELLPKRRLWLCKGQRTFKVVVNKETKEKEVVKLDTDEKNREILYNTIKKYLNKKNNFEFVINLNKFILDIQSSIENETFIIEKPDIVPEIKELNKSKQNLQLKKHNAIECRPISRFLLKDRIVLSLTNKFLTELFDDYFEKSALAFRAIKDSESRDRNHHLAIKKIIEYKESYSDTDLFVAECDMKKFYDTVNHKICLDSFNKLIEKAKVEFPKLELSKAIYLFNAYLKCYTFIDNVKPLNGVTSYWEKQKDTKQKQINGFYPWVEDDFNKSAYYKEFPKDRIGVPQGGALSGLIANIMLDYSDKKLKDISDLLYVRYCDDMILIHPNESICKNAIDVYQKSINELQLFNHPFKNNFFVPNKNRISKKTKADRVYTTINLRLANRSFDYSIKPFWNDSKSKGPYKWGIIDKDSNTLPWIGFVGYEINFNCETRIRKKSLKKELDKQKKVVTSIIKRIKKTEFKNARNNSIYKSALEKLNGMSVGRIKLYNYQICENKICWADGFRCLKLNKYSKIQLRALDRNKYKFLNILTKHLDVETIASEQPDNNEDILKMKKPFSYYYQAGEKKVMGKNVPKEIIENDPLSRSVP